MLDTHDKLTMITKNLLFKSKIIIGDQTSDIQCVFENQIDRLAVYLAQSEMCNLVSSLLLLDFNSSSVFPGQF